MARIQGPSEAVCTASRAAHDIALAALLGGNLFGRYAMASALEEVSDKAERGKVLNRSWQRYGTVNSVALLALVGGWLPTRLNGRRLTERERRLTRAKDVAVGAVVVSGLASAAGGLRFAQQAPGGAVPMDSGYAAAAEASPRAARLKRIAGALGALNFGSEMALAVINASLAQPSPRRRRLLR